MPFSSSNLSRDELLSRYFPQYYPVASASGAGLTGASCVIQGPTRRLVLRQHHDASAPKSAFHRQYRALASLPSTLAPRPAGYYPGWLVAEYVEGMPLEALSDINAVTLLLYHLHQQPRFGWRVRLLPLLKHYWQECDASRRFPLWLRWLQRLCRSGEPQPLRLSPLHMDVHPGNIIQTARGLRLIDWEYAGDGDIALELAAVWVTDPCQRQALIAAYAGLSGIPESQLVHQVRRWRPWVLMLMAGWFEYRWQQTGDRQFIALADDSWRQLMIKK